MTIDNAAAPRTWDGRNQPTSRVAMGAADRWLWSSFARREEVDSVVAALQDTTKHGLAVLGPWGVGKTTLARAVKAALAETTHIVRIFGSPTETLVPYGSLALLMVRLPPGAPESPGSVIRGIADLIRADADGRDVLLVIDDLPGLDPMTVGVIMHLLLSRSAKVLVMARDLGQLPEDLVWLVKDGMLAEFRLHYFTRAEVGSLIAKATQKFISQSALSALYEASGGVPLVLQALFQEQVANGSLVLRRGGWVISGPIDLDSANVEKLALIRKAPLEMVISVLGEDTVVQLEERGFLEISADKSHQVALRERYVGDVVRGLLPQERMAELFSEIADGLHLRGDSLGPLEVMSLAAWTLDAGMVLQPRFALAAARDALRHFDAMLALRCTAQIPADNVLCVPAAQASSAAYRIMANYQQAVAILANVPPACIARLGIAEFGSWVLSRTGSLLWVQDGCNKIPGILAHAEEVLGKAAGTATHADIRTARELIRLAYFEYQVHRGEFKEIIGDLEAASNLESDYGLNCASLLVPTLAVVGRELEAIALGRQIDCEVLVRGLSPRFANHYRDGLAYALTWTGQWIECVDMLHIEFEASTPPECYRGGLRELNLGVAQAYGGNGEDAVGVLLAAAAQLEVLDSEGALGLAYSALAFAYAKVGNEQEAVRCLALAGSVQEPCSWINGAMARFFQLLAQRWLDDSKAADKLCESARADIDKGRFAFASMALFGGTVNGSDKGYELLEEVSLRRQGPMPSVNVALARSWRTRDAGQALKAAALARDLKLDAVESRCLVVALDFARENGEKSVARAARQRLEELKNDLAMLPVMPQADGVRLTHRELQIAKLAKRGLGNRAIADRIGVSVRTVEGHLYQVYIKRGITTRRELEQDQEL